MGLFAETSMPALLIHLEAWEEKGISVPDQLQADILHFKKTIGTALISDEQQLEQAFEGLFPKLWELRLAVLPLLKDVDQSKTWSVVGDELGRIADNFPPLSVTTARLQYGVGLMLDFLKVIVAKEPELFYQVPNLTKEQVLGYEEIIAKINDGAIEQGPLTASFLNGSLMMDLLLFALHQIAEHHTAPTLAMCQELQYLASVAVQDYALGLGVEEHQLPWYKKPKSDFQKLLLSGPVATKEQLQFIEEKRAQFNLWP